MDEGQRKLLFGAVALIVVAVVLWFVFTKNGPRNGVTDLPENKATAAKRPAPGGNGMRTGGTGGGQLPGGGGPAPE